jgi:hypothetical protein
VQAGDNGAVTILLGPKAGGAQGTFSYSLKIPDNLDRAELIISTAGGGAVETIPLSYSASGITGSRNLDPGEYLARIRLVRGAGNAAVYAGLAEALHIYSGLDSALPFKAYTAEDFKTAVGALDLTDLVSAPAVLADPVTVFAGNAQYTGSVAWKESNGVTPLTGIFEAGRVYKAVVTLTAAAERTFAGVAENSFIYGGAAVSNAADSGVVTITFPETPPYVEIGTAEELAKIGAEAGYPLDGRYKLTADLTLSDWVPIGGDDAPFAGVFYGDNRTITLNGFAAAALSGRKYFGVFGSVEGSSAASRAELKSLAIIASINQTVTASGTAAGLLAGYAENAYISDIALSGSFGFASARVIIVGGIAGSINGSVSVKNCAGSVDMTIAGGSSGNNIVGGFCGSAWRSEIINCHNTGSITADATDGYIYCGGIAGYFNNGTASPLATGTIEGCSSIGDIAAGTTGGVKDAYVGGIAGYANGGGGSSISDPARITKCRVEGNISGSSPGTNSMSYVGGIAGYNVYYLLISQSYFNGTVTESNTGSMASCCGGIAGNNNYGSRIEDCWSHGTVTGVNNAGGIAGRNDSMSSHVAYIARCYSTAGVVRTGSGDTDNGAGGIAGNNRYNSTGAIADCAALNSGISSAGGVSIHRVAGSASAAVLTNNYAWTGMIITPNGGTYTADTGADKADGADVASGKPDRAFYETTLAWDFDEVWEMGAGGYPKLQWQDEQ